MNQSDLTKGISRAIRSFNTDHPESQIPLKIVSSISKRIGGEIKDYLAEIHAQREMLNWIFRNKEKYVFLVSDSSGDHGGVLAEMYNSGEYEELFKSNRYLKKWAATYTQNVD